MTPDMKTCIHLW